MTADPSATQDSSIEISAATENVIDTYQITAEWIRFADAKAAVVLTVNGALASVLVPTLKPFLQEFRGAADPRRWLLIAVIASMAVFGVCAIGSSVAAFRCILPARRGGRHPAIDACRNFHPAAISQHYQLDEVERFRNDFATSGGAGFQRQVLAGLLIDAHISASKYQHLSSAIRTLGVAALAGFLYLALTQF